MASDREHNRNAGYNRSSRTPNRDSRNPKADLRGRDKPEPKNGLLDSVMGFFFSVAIGISSFFKKISGGKNKSYMKYVYIAAGAIIIIFAGYLIYWSATNINAQTVYLDETKIGTVKIPKTGEIEASYIEELAVKKITLDVGADVKVNEKVSVKAVHAKDKELVSLDSVVADITKQYTYKVAAVSITVDGTEMAVVASEAIADEILNGIKDSYNQSTLNITSSDFVEDVKKTAVYVDKEDLITKDAAYTILTANSKAEQTYEIKSGDMLGKIATDAGMTLEELLKINPTYTPTTILKIGDKLMLSVSKPLLSVKTVERKTYIAVIPKPVDKIPVATRKKGNDKIIQQGSDGQQEVTADIIRINGFEEAERDIISTKILVEPVKEIIEVGTK